MKRIVCSSAQIAKKNLYLLAEILKRMNITIAHIVVAKWMRSQTTTIRIINSEQDLESDVELCED